MKLAMGRPIFAGFFLTLVVFFVLLVSIEIVPRLELFRAIALGTSVAVGVRYFLGGWNGLWEKDPNHYPGAILALGISLLWIAEPMGDLVHFLWRIHGQPAWLINNEFMAFALWLKIVAAGLHILAPPGVIAGMIPPRNTVLLAASVGVGFFIFMVALLLSERPVGWLDFLRPVIEENGGSQYGRRSIISVPWMTA